MTEDFVGEAVDVKAAQKYFDGLFFSGTADQVRLDHRVLSTIVRRAPMKTEGKLSSFIGMQMRDPSFQASLERLESRGYIIRRTREWGVEGKWVELSEDCRTAIATTKGEHMGYQRLDQLLPGMEG